jgi:hypothetical protein
MPHTLRPLSLGQLLDQTFNIYRTNFLLFIGISAIPNVALLALQFGFSGIVSMDRKEVGIATVIGGLFTLVASAFVAALVTAATTLGVSDIYLDRPTTIMSCFSRVARKAPRVVFVSFVVGLIVGVGTLLCIIPGIYWAGVYGIAVPAAVLEDIPGPQAISRSKDLTRDSVGRIIVVYFLTTIFTIGMLVALDAGLNLVGLAASTKFLHKQVLDQVLTTLGGIVFGPITAIALTLAYYDQRVRKEAFDIEHMMALMVATGNAAPESTPPEASA